MICITGVPGTGKSTISAELAGMGFEVCDAAAVAEKAGCISDREVDIKCLLQNGDFSRCDVVQSHFSHHLQCAQVVILETDPETLEKRLKDRGYSELKVRENIDAQLSGTIYYESLERLPAGRIRIMDTSSGQPASIAEEIASLPGLHRKK